MITVVLFLFGNKNSKSILMSFVKTNKLLFSTLEKLMVF
ncbi:hypothetical protein LRLP16767_LR202_00071 [Limosilactobacillus reuteri]|uniref:Uncharacterized protein n=1 Tax=Limosilactobacillus reuteri TaxID=1598 RepID=A0A0U5D2M8_LIMRT|nr:hypothetical protein LRLP16767_LR3C6_00758 [Limosilactobacillus reuteri subsp. porcinus]CUR40021.1 hypothetical protein LRLP16767_LR202_00071 [Limosilactobacillus reuteri]